MDTSTADEPLYCLYRKIEKVRQRYGKFTAEAKAEMKSVRSLLNLDLDPLRVLSPWLENARTERLDPAAEESHCFRSLRQGFT